MSTRSSRTARGAVVAGLAAALLVPGIASAETVTSKDVIGDTWRDASTADAEVYTPAGSTVNTDLVRTVVKHTATRVVIRSTFAELKKTGRNTFFFVRVRTNEGVRRDTGIDTFGSNAGAHHFTKPNGDKELACAGLSHKVDYDLDRMTVSIPRSCLSNPKWVQFISAAVSFDSQGDTVIDNGQSGTSDDPTVSPKWSARIHKA